MSAHSPRNSQSVGGGNELSENGAVGTDVEQSGSSHVGPDLECGRLATS